VKENKQT